ncbi:MAG: TIGR00341 family protein [Candidatus Nanohaloarchaea archaeon]|nr:TIGR00341 family protein [Candidatus Nanohaloarchaea archaeon]
MKRVDVTVPKGDRDEVREAIEEFSSDIITSEVKKDGKKFVQFQISIKSKDIDDLIDSVKHLKDLDTGDLTIEVLDQKARVEKGKQIKGESSTMSVQEMYQKAFEFSSFNLHSWALIALSAGIAELGVVMESVIVVIGAMVIAPLLGPFISASFGLVIGDRRLIQDSLVHAALGVLLAIGSAYLISTPVAAEVNALMELISNPTFATIPLSLFVGSAAALTFASGRDESLAGIAVSIALVPPAAVAGLTLSMGNFSMFADVMLVLTTNLASLILAGSATFKFLGISPSTYHRKKISEERLKQAVTISLVSIILLGVIFGYFSYQNLQTSRARASIDSVVKSQFGERILKYQTSLQGTEANIKLIVVNPKISASELKSKIKRRTDREINLELLAVKKDTSMSVG